MNVLELGLTGSRDALLRGRAAGEARTGERADQQGDRSLARVSPAEAWLWEQWAGLRRGGRWVEPT